MIVLQSAFVKHDRKPTMDDVAARAGVSRALVSLTLRDSPKVSATSRAAVLRAARDLGYRPNLNARNLASKRTRTLGVVVNDLHNPYFPAVVDGVRRAAEAHGYRLLLNSAFLDTAVEAHALDTLIDFQVDGIVLVGSRLGQGAIEAVARSVPVVVASRPMVSPSVSTVNNDDRRGAESAVQHLVTLGHRHIWHIDGGTGAGAAERRAGYTATMERHGLVPRVEPGLFTEASGVAAAERIFASGESCTAIFAGNDLSALGALDVIDDAGLRVPDDISLVGYDNTFIAALHHISLTSVDQNRERLGERAVMLLIERLDHGHADAVREVVQPELVVRQTTAPPR
jgi:DNA-binding LacI/PurR family transcriptional regulator